MTNGSQTEDLREMIQCTLEHLIPKDKDAEETEHHRRIGTLTGTNVKERRQGLHHRRN